MVDKIKELVLIIESFSKKAKTMDKKLSLVYKDLVKTEQPNQKIIAEIIVGDLEKLADQFATLFGKAGRLHELSTAFDSAESACITDADKLDLQAIFNKVITGNRFTRESLVNAIAEIQQFEVEKYNAELGRKTILKLLTRCAATVISKCVSPKLTKRIGELELAVWDEPMHLQCGMANSAIAEINALHNKEMLDKASVVRKETLDKLLTLYRELFTMGQALCKSDSDNVEALMDKVRSAPHNLQTGMAVEAIVKLHEYLAKYK